MKERFLIIIVYVISCCTTVCAHQNVSDGKLIEYLNFESQYVSNRDVYVWLPSNYNPNRKYAVLYMHDGQMLFDKTTTWNGQEWDMDENCGYLLRNKVLDDFIIVAIANVAEERFYDYCPEKVLKYLSEKDISDAGVNKTKFSADNYLKFIVDEVKPFVDKKYSTYTDSKHTFIMGSSMGGLISFYAICEYPKVFGGAACLSIHTPILTNFALDKSVYDNWANAFAQYVSENLPDARNHKIYMDYGNKTLDALYPIYQNNLNSIMIKNGWNSMSWVTRFFPGAAHTETDWSKRILNPLMFLMTNPHEDRILKICQVDSLEDCVKHLIVYGNNVSLYEPIVHGAELVKTERNINPNCLGLVVKCKSASPARITIGLTRGSKIIKSKYMIN